MSAELRDNAERSRALDPGNSFIVQAPAGSGKTELLTRRFLRLLAVVEQPEEVVAITFTRKAAGVMRARVLEALRDARRAAPDAPFAREQWELARAAKSRDEELGWNLAGAPARLKIMTIDALCHALVAKSPLQSGLGAQPKIADQPRALYVAAALQTLRRAQGEDRYGKAVRRVLSALDNNAARLQTLLCSMLERRDQWLAKTVAARPDLDYLGSAFRREAQRRIVRLWQWLGDDLVNEWAAVCRYACGNLEQEVATPVANLRGITLPPGTNAEDVAAWQAMVELALTRAGDWRKSVDKRLGFPAKGAATTPAEQAEYEEAKARHRALVDRFREIGGLLDALLALKALPPDAFTPAQEDRLQALLDTLMVAAAELRLVFAERGEVDFIEVAHRAVAALGDELEPSDLAFYMDYRIKHLLVDEFQDTSFTQLKLIERLVDNFEPDGERSLFLVGDPMQSIYRFREAEVGLFLEAKSRGVGPVRLTPLTLQTNFRSESGLVEWVNRVFAQVFPAVDEASRGAVSYARAVAAQQRHPAGTATVRVFQGEGALEREAEEVCRLVEQTQARAPESTVAILGRTKNHLSRITMALRAKGIGFQAVDLEPLSERPAIIELVALTRALSHHGDRLAWLAVLRAPWCGLRLVDLEAVALATSDLEPCVWPVLTSPVLAETLSGDGRARVARVVASLAPVVERAGIEPLAVLVERAWLGLGGPACAREERDLEDASRYFELLTSVDDGGTVSDFAALADRVQELFAVPGRSASGSVQVMTIHKAKGLEFDTVILPALGQGVRDGDAPLVSWAQVADERGEAELLLAPMRQRGEDDDPHYAYVKHLNDDRDRFEQARLAYVACTRAKRDLHLIGHVSEARQGADHVRPAKGTLLALLWDALADELGAAPELEPAVAYPGGVQQASERAAWVPQTAELTRLPDDYSLPEPPPGVATSASRPPVSTELGQPPYRWAGGIARAVGIVVHRLLLRTDARPEVFESLPEAWREWLSAELQDEGVGAADLKDAVGRAALALRNIASDPQARWALLEPHRQSRRELAITGWLDGRLEERVIDRTFVDDGGKRWIIDVKTSWHEGGDVEGFLTQEVMRYRPQLELYARLLRSVDDRSVRAGLYFPMHSAWREVSL